MICRSCKHIFTFTKWRGSFKLQPCTQFAG